MTSTLRSPPAEFSQFYNFLKKWKKGKNELELTSKLTSPPTKVFTSGKTSYTKTSLKKSPKLNRFFFTKSCSLSFFSLKSSNQPYLKFPYFFQIVLLEVPKKFFLQKIVLKPLLTPLFSPDIFLRGGQTPNRSVGQQSGRTRSARDFWPPLRASQGGQYRFRVGK